MTLPDEYLRKFSGKQSEATVEFRSKTETELYRDADGRTRTEERPIDLEQENEWLMHDIAELQRQILDWKFHSLVGWLLFGIAFCLALMIAIGE